MKLNICLSWFSSFSLYRRNKPEQIVRNNVKPLQIMLGVVLEEVLLNVFFRKWGDSGSTYYLATDIEEILEVVDD